MDENEELIMLAAKAEGREPPIDSNGVFNAWVGSVEHGHWWNPLTDDGDALKLAVKLDLHIRFYRKHVDVDGEVRGGGVISEDFQVSSRKNEAARLAIVRAAAEIGKLLP